MAKGMKLIYIYGPPGVGKLTVAKELARMTGYHLFHNHMTFEIFNPIFPFGTKPFFDLSAKFRYELIETAAKERVSGLIFTFVYWKGEDDRFMRNVIRRVEKHHGKVCFVRLHCNVKELFKRVIHPSRRKFGKLKTVKSLKKLMKEKELYGTVPFENNLTIDNTNLSPKAAARKIKSYFKL